MFFIVSLTLTLLAIFLLARRVSKNKFILSIIIFLLSFLVMFLSYFLPDKQRFIIINREDENFLIINGQRKYDVIKDFFSSLNPYYIAETGSKNDILISSKTKSFNLNGKVDFGIDSVIQDDILKKVIFKNFTLFDTTCSAKIFVKDKIYNIEFKRDTIFEIEVKNNIDSVKIISNDDNEYNNYYLHKTKFQILLLDDNYTKTLQNLSLKISSLYDSVTFNTGILKENKILSLKKDYDGIIYIGKTPSNIINIQKIKYDGINVNFFQNLEEIISRIKEKNKSVKNPFNDKKNYKNNIFTKFLFFLKGYFILIFLFVLFFLILAFLF
ncbi:MAG: hypothetical protein ABIN00_07630 [candidate division WOR-3 bacterium]